MTRHLLYFKFAMILVLLLAAGGCVTKPSPPTSFYMLATLAPAPEGLGDGAEARKTMIGIETVRVPAYLDRNQIVTSLDHTEFALADFDHWAEPLSDTLTRVVAENLSRMLAGLSVQVLPATRSIPFDYSVDIEILRLDGKMNDQATLAARWAIFGPGKRELKDLQKSEYREIVAEDSYKELVMAYSRLVDRMCRDIANTLKNEMARS